MKRLTILTLLFALFLSPLAMGATFRWQGDEADIPQIDTLDFGGTWTSGEDVIMTMGAKDITMTTGATIDTIAEVAAAFVEVFNATSTEDLISVVTVTAMGQDYPEFQDAVASIDPDDNTIVWITSSTPGWPFTFAIDVSGSAAGTATLVSDGTGDSQEATGGEWANNDDNWSPSLATLAEDDTLLFDRGDKNMRHGITFSVQSLNVTVTNGYGGEWGLPATNIRNSSGAYDEYRTTHVVYPSDDDDTSDDTQTFVIGDEISDTNASFFLRINFGAEGGGNTENQIVTVYDSPPRVGGGDPGVSIEGGGDIDLAVYNGSVIVNQDATSTASVLTSLSLVGTNPSVELTSTCTTATSAPLYVHKGTFINDAAAGATNDIFLYGGKSTISPSVTWDEMQIYDGAECMCYSGGTNLHIFGGGKFHIPGITLPGGLSNVYMRHSASYIDDGITLPSNGWFFEGCSPQDCTFQIRDNIQLDPTVITP